MARAVFVDKRDMPDKLYPNQFRVTGTFTRTEDGSELPLELHVELTDQEAARVLCNACVQKALLGMVRDIVLVEVNRHLATDRVPQLIIDQINGKVQVSDPPKEE